ncbi:TPA: hypothetical protein ANIA_11454 [Aspergillus nidulans FGSC A4]|uniref:Uncharacterized protein n=1 Tax=Emericella nidulans (strain FGSC A4 / ATCC 38163 / CBS 112.46 / NRRL 194 / M139) TaxID=227321 RepID=C8V8M4_EMENI|nr:TPA: hypothetical protein ANIA_11454 [Aspergillus nidulans FGSC A4]
MPDDKDACSSEEANREEEALNVAATK